MAKYDEKAKARTMKYMKEKRDKLTLNLPLGDKERFKAYAESKGKSLTALIIDLIEADMINEQKAAEPKKRITDIPKSEVWESVSVTIETSAGKEYVEEYSFFDFLNKRRDKSEEEIKKLTKGVKILINQDFRDNIASQIMDISIMKFWELRGKR